VPTYEEAGIKGLVLEQWIGVFVPAGTPNQIIARLNAEIVKALSTRKFVNALLKRPSSRWAARRSSSSPWFAADYEKYGRLVRELNIKID